MEYIVYILAALAAGVGTGLAGLSAATVMVPMLIVLCPSFAGETGAYHATAVALASDILGSAVTSAIYIKHKNIDLKRGGLVMACVVAMCIAGSIVAWSAGNVVLGTTSLILCVAIGIRFLVKPDSERDNTTLKGAKLDWKGIVISLFFGLTIGFGTGFLGSGGGMMMLLVFTAFLGMERRSAVGTSTFIMTFTALIAFVSHALVDPSIVTAHMDALVIGIVVATIASIVSAQFANKVNNRTVGLVTGAILLVLGIFLIVLNYWEVLSSIPLIGQVLRCMGWYLLFLAGIIVIVLTLRLAFKVPSELSRKMLHFPAMASMVFMLGVAETWLAAVICAIVFALAIYPALCLLERWKGYDALFIQRKPGEVKKSLFLLFGTHAAIAAFCCGVLGKPYIAITAILVWGFGDIAAALVGKRFGKHPTMLPHADPHKTWEGTVAMAITAAITAVITLQLISPLPLHMCVLFACIIAPFAAAIELLSHNGNDTASVPLGNFLVLTLLCLLPMVS